MLPVCQGGIRIQILEALVYDTSSYICIMFIVLGCMLKVVESALGGRINPWIELGIGCFIDHHVLELSEDKVVITIGLSMRQIFTIIYIDIIPSQDC